jgi:hypothetical protein
VKAQIAEIQEGTFESFFILADGSASELEKLKHMEICSFLRFVKEKRIHKKPKSKKK